MRTIEKAEAEPTWENPERECIARLPLRRFSSGIFEGWGRFIAFSRSFLPELGSLLALKFSWVA